MVVIYTVWKYLVSSNYIFYQWMNKIPLTLLGDVCMHQGEPIFLKRHRALREDGFRLISEWYGVSCQSRM